jgi:outer membrane protein assembly factor BamB
VSSAPARPTSRFALSVLAVTVLASRALAEDWPTYRRDAQRTGASEADLTFPLSREWTFQPAHPPNRAWPDPGLLNPHGKARRRGSYVNTLQFDHAMHPICVGGRVYLGSSSQHTIHCIDIATGREVWVYFTEGPVRMAPTVAGGQLYAGSDDGHVVCLDAATGQLIWRTRIAPDDSRLPGNEQMISRCPLRSGVIVQDGVAYTAAGLFPHREGCFLVALDAKTGEAKWRQKIDQPAQGYLAASGWNIIVPSGRGGASSYAIHDGKRRAGVAAARGSTALIYEADDLLLFGPGWWGTQMSAVEAGQTDRRIATYNARHALMTSTAVFLWERGGGLSRVPRVQIRLKGLEARRKDAEKRKDEMAVDRIDESIKAARAELKAAISWKTRTARCNQLIQAGKALILAGDGEVSAVHVDTGKQIWSSEVAGRAHGLAVADGRLLVSTSTGEVHCFRAGRHEPKLVREVGFEAAEPLRKTRAGTGASPAGESVAPVEPLKRPGRAAAIILDRAGIVTPGYCLDVAPGDGRLALEIARRSRLTVIAVEPDRAKISALRKMLRESGAYGHRVVVLHASPEKLPFSRYTFNLIVSGSGRLPASSPEIRRVLRPSGGVACFTSDERTATTWLADGKFTTATACEGVKEFHVKHAAGWLTVRRGPLPGAGEWTHQYANPANTTCSEDTRVGVPVQMQWHGRPGPRRIFDRHSLTPAPLYANGRMFVIGENILYASDAYNGTPLWSVELPDMEPRVNMSRDSGYAVATAEAVYVAAGANCLVFDAATGAKQPGFSLGTVHGNVRPPILIEDFEGTDYGKWKVEGTAFGKRPARGTLPWQYPVLGFKGKGLVNTFLGERDQRQGKLTSPEFKIERPYIRFLLAGGNHPGKACINLLIGGKVVETATGQNSEHLIARVWGVEKHIGKKARIQIVDAISTDWGHINVDHIEQCDLPVDYEWGYLAVDGGTLFGTGVRGGNFYRNGRGPNYKWQKGKVTGDYLFATDLTSGKVRWRHNGLVIHPSITIGGGRVYFVEHRDKRAEQSPIRVLSEHRKLAVVALDQETGRKLWEVGPFDYSGDSPILFGQYKDEVYVLARTTKQYDLVAYDAKTGKVRWSRNHRPTHWHHGAFRRKTILVGDDVLQGHVAYSLKTGEPTWRMFRRRKCNTPAASAYYLVMRHWWHSIVDINVLRGLRDDEASERLTQVTRPGCWVNVVPAGGLVLCPESASGCSCDFPIRTSLAFVCTADKPVTATAGPKPLRKPPVHRYSFNGTGKHIKDSLGKSHGVLKATTEMAKLDGKGKLILTAKDQVSLPPGMLKGLRDASLEFWIAPTAKEYKWSAPVFFGNGPDRFYYCFRTLTLHRAEISVNGHNEDIQQRVPTEPGTWMHVVVAYDHDGADGKPQLICYRNGRLAGKLETGLKLTEVEDNDNRLGAFDGIYDEVRVYDYALSLPEVMSTYEAGPDRLPVKAE